MEEGLNQGLHSDYIGVQQPTLIPETHILDESRLWDQSIHTDLRAFVHALERSVIASPRTPHILAAVGESHSGKLSLALEVASLLTDKSSDLSDFCRKKGFRINKDLFTWGHAFGFIPSQEFPLDFSQRDKSRIQVAEAEPLFFNGLARTIKSYQTQPTDDHTINLGIFDIVANTGYRTSEGKEYGLPRAFDRMGNFARQEGEFAGLVYSPWVMGVSADNELWLNNLEVRKRAQGISNPEYKARVLGRLGKKVRVNNLEELNRYAKDEANEANGWEIRREVNKLLLDLARDQVISLQDYVDISRIQPEDFDHQGTQAWKMRPNILGTILHPLLLRHWGFVPEQTASVFNFRQVDETVLDYTGFRYPLLEMYGSKG